MRKVVFGILVVLLVVLICGTSFAARGGRPHSRAGNEDCSAWTFGPCEPKNNETCGRGTKQATRTGLNCAEKTKTFPCKLKCSRQPGGVRCQYKPVKQIRKLIQNAPCDASTGKKTVNVPLTRGDPNTCAATKAITRKCVAGSQTRGDARRRPVRDVKQSGRGRNRGARTTTPVAPAEAGKAANARSSKGRQQRCKYTKSSWSQCDVASNTRTKTMTLKPGSPSTCNAEKVVTKPCKKPRSSTVGAPARQSKRPRSQ